MADNEALYQAYGEAMALPNSKPRATPGPVEIAAAERIKAVDRKGQLGGYVPGLSLTNDERQAIAIERRQRQAESDRAHESPYERKLREAAEEQQRKAAEHREAYQAQEARKAAERHDIDARELVEAKTRWAAEQQATEDAKILAWHRQTKDRPTGRL